VLFIERGVQKGSFMKNTGIPITAQKAAGRYYTPDYLVRTILDLAGYRSSAVLEKHIIDNSCGDGAFLVEIADRYCREFLNAGGTKAGLKRDLARYIHGIEIELSEWGKTVNRLNEIALHYGVNQVEWDILNTDALDAAGFGKKSISLSGIPPMSGFTISTAGLTESSSFGWRSRE